MEKQPQKILVRGVNWIGDAVMTIPAMRGLRQLFPESLITLLMREPIDQLFSHFSAVDRVTGFTVRKGAAGLADRLALIRKLRRERYDRCVILPNSFDSALVPFLCGIPERLGFDRDGRRLLLTRPVPPPLKATGGHQAGDYVHLVSRFGPVQVSLDPRLDLDPGADRWARERLRVLKKQVEGPLVGFNPGATYGPAKRWFPDRFAGVAARICSESKGGIVIVGGSDETELGREVALRIQGPVIDLSGQTSLQQLAALLSRLDLLVTNDSGPMHLASAVGTPVVAIFGSTEPGATAPLGVHQIVRHETECAPCLERLCPRGDMLCMERVGVDEVYQAVQGLLPSGVSP